MSPRAEQEKQAGNTAFRAGQLDLALAHYSTAIALDPAVATYPLNRAAVHLRRGDPRAAERDATTALELDGGHSPKALFRRATARRLLGQLEQARADFLQAKQQGAAPEEVDRELAALLAQTQALEFQEKDAAPAPATAPSTERLRAALASPPPPPARPSPSQGSASKDYMTPLSTRRLSPSSNAPAPAAPSAAPAVRPVGSFAAQKQARAARQAAPPLSRNAPAAAPTTDDVSAGVPEPAPLPATSDAAAAAAALGPTSPTTTTTATTKITPPLPAQSEADLLPSAVGAPPHSATALETHFLTTSPGAPSRLALLRALDPHPARLRAFFGPGGIGPDLLSALLAEVLPPGGTNGSDADDEWVAPLLRGLTATTRWDSAVLFLDDAERAGVRTVLDREAAQCKLARERWGV